MIRTIKNTKLVMVFSMLVMLFMALPAQALSMFGGEQTPVGTSPQAVTTGDFNGDGFVDMAVANKTSNNVSVLLGAGDGTFSAAVNYAAGTSPVSITNADFNGDGFLDLAVVIQNNVSILLGVGDGTFSTAVNYASGLLLTESVTTGDFNGDGFVDMAIAGLNIGSSNVSVLLGVGNGTFTAAVSYVVSARAYSVTTADFNGDGFLDLAVAIQNNVSVLLGVGDGTFNAEVTYALAGIPTSITIGDFNGDSSVDLAVTIPNNVSVLLGVGNGTFNAAVDHAAGTSPSSVATGDFNGDGFVDMAVTDWNIGSLTLRILLGVGDGTFNASINYAAGVTPRSVTTSDFNGDGFIDLGIVNINTSSISIFLGAGNGTFNGALNYVVGSNAESVTTGDFNGDGFVDMAVANYTSNNISVLLGAGDGAFNTAVNYTVGTTPSSVTTSDFNGDGFIDIAVANYTSNDVSVLLGVGNGTFGTAVSNMSGGTGLRSVTTGDFNGDGYVDMAVANYSSNDVSVLLGAGVGTFSTAVNYVSGGTGPNAVTTGDFNGDGFVDMAVTNQNSNNVSVLSGVGDGTFSAAVNYGSGGTTPLSVTTNDFNGDGYVDMAVANYASNAVSVLLGVGNGTFSAAVSNMSGGTGSSSVATGDFNGDGYADMAVANRNSNNLSILLGVGDGTFNVPVNYAAGAAPKSVATGDFNGDGSLDLVLANSNANNVSIMLNQLDFTVPTGIVTIDAGNAFTSTTAVILSLTCNDNIACTQMQFSNDNLNWGGWVSNAASSAWTLAAGADGVRDVYTQFKDTAGNISSVVIKDQITLETRVNVSFGGGCISQGGIGQFYLLLPMILLLSIIGVLNRRKSSLGGSSFLALALSFSFMLPAVSDAAEAEDKNWRVGAGIGAFKMTVSYPGNSETYSKVLSGYVVNLGYMAVPWLETGVLITGGNSGEDTQGQITTGLELPALPQVYAKIRQDIDEDLGFYELLTLGSLKQEAANSAGNTLFSDSIAIIGLGAGVSWYASDDWTMDMGIFAPNLIQASTSSGLKTKEVGLIVAFNYAFGFGSGEATPREVQDVVAAVSMVTPQPVEPIIVTPEPVTVEIIDLEGVYFASGGSDLDGSSAAVLDQAVDTLLRRTDINVEVAAHSDNVGRDKSNLLLSERRAQSVRTYLIVHGVSGDRIKAKGYGSNEPVAYNGTEIGRAKNRRVELRVQE